MSVFSSSKRALKTDVDRVFLFSMVERGFGISESALKGIDVMNKS